MTRTSHALSTCQVWWRYAQWLLFYSADIHTYIHTYRADKCPIPATKLAWVKINQPENLTQWHRTERCGGAARAVTFRITLCEIRDFRAIFVSVTHCRDHSIACHVWDASDDAVSWRKILRTSTSSVIITTVECIQRVQTSAKHFHVFFHAVYWNQTVNKEYFKKIISISSTNRENDTFLWWHRPCG